MAWLRIDDGFTSNSKIAQLTNQEFRVWIRLLCHCARSRDPSVDRAALNEVAGLTKPLAARYADLELLDRVGNEYEVHDWASYLPKDAQNADRQARWRSRKRNAGSNAPRNGAVDARHNAGSVTSRAGTRGVPSRPVLDETEW